MTHSDHDEGELEVKFRPENSRAVIEGKTVVPFQSFVTLVLQRKVLSLFKTWGKHPVIVDSELLTSMASAAQDNQENRTNMVLVSLCLGAILGIAFFSLVQTVLLKFEIVLGMKELLIITGSVVVIAVLLKVAMKLRRLPRGEKLVETVEGISSFLR